MGREGDAAVTARSRSPNVGASAAYFLKRYVPPARHQPAGDEVDDARFGPGSRLNRQQLGGERNHIRHARKLARAATSVSTAQRTPQRGKPALQVAVSTCGMVGCSATPSTA